MWPTEETLMTREWKAGLDDGRRVSLRRLKSSKCEKRLVPNWDSNPLAVLT